MGSIKGCSFLRRLGLFTTYSDSLLRILCDLIQTPYTSQNYRDRVPKIKYTAAREADFSLLGITVESCDTNRQVINLVVVR